MAIFSPDFDGLLNFAPQKSVVGHVLLYFVYFVISNLKGLNITAFLCAYIKCLLRFSVISLFTIFLVAMAIALFSRKLGSINCSIILNCRFMCPFPSLSNFGFVPWQQWTFYTGVDVATVGHLPFHKCFY